MKLTALFIALLFTFSACQDTTNIDEEAILMSVFDLNTRPGFSWFEQNISDYSPDNDIVEQIKAEYNPSTHSFVLFVKPSCGCQGTQVQFPQLVKIFREAGISEDKYKIYAMTSHENKIPYQDLILTDLPTFLVYSNGEVVGSVLETLETLPVNSKMENALLEVLK